VVKFLRTVFGKLLTERPLKPSLESPKFLVMPYIHGFANRLDKQLNAHGVRVVSTYRNKLHHLPLRVGRAKCANTVGTCKTGHKEVNVFNCDRSGIIYKLVTGCGNVYTSVSLKDARTSD